MVPSAVLMVSSFEAGDDTHDLVGVGEKNKTNNCMLRCTILTQFGSVNKSGTICSAQLFYPNRNKTVR